MVDEQIVAFCRSLASVRRLFRKAHISVEKSRLFAKVNCEVSHAEKDILEGEVRLPAVEISYSLDSELAEVADDGRHSIGASVAIYFVRDRWECVGEIGWSCHGIGWVEYHSKAKAFDSARELIADLPNFTEEILEEYGKLIQKEFPERDE